MKALISNRIWYLALGVCGIAFAPVGFVRAANIVWQAPQNIMADSDVLTDGQSVYAYHMNINDRERFRKVNGVYFFQNSVPCM